MKKGLIFKSRALAWIFSLAMVLTMTPMTAFAEENLQPAGCAHIHDENCGYVILFPCISGHTEQKI